MCTAVEAFFFLVVLIGFFLLIYIRNRHTKKWKKRVFVLSLYSLSIFFFSCACPCVEALVFGTGVSKEKKSSELGRRRIRNCGIESHS